MGGPRRGRGRWGRLRPRGRRQGARHLRNARRRRGYADCAREGTQPRAVIHGAVRGGGGVAERRFAVWR